MDNKHISEDNRIDEANEIQMLDLNEEEQVKEDAVAVVDISEQEDEAAKKRAMRKEIISWVLTVVITVAVITVLRNFVLINAEVPTGSMENTIMPKDRLFGSRLAYEFGDPERGDIIFFYFPDNETEKFIKRIIGLPGEKLTIIDGKVYINDSTEPLDEPYLKEEWVIGTGPYEFHVPEDSYFVMGDNRNGSQDARYWKNTYVTRDKIIGKAGIIYFPFSRIGVLK